MMNKRLLVHLVSLLSITCFGQRWNETKVSQNLQVAVNYVDMSMYIEADSMFKEILRNAEVLPDEITYQFGRNSFYLDQHRQAINWLRKYLELKGSKGRYADQANLYIKRATQKISLSQSVEVDSINQTRVKPPCNEGDMVVCPVCNGTRVIIRRGVMGLHYQTCPYDNGNGLISCEDYQKYLSGQLKFEGK